MPTQPCQILHLMAHPESKWEANKNNFYLPCVTYATCLCAFIQRGKRSKEVYKTEDKIFCVPLLRHPLINLLPIYFICAPNPETSLFIQFSHPSILLFAPPLPYLIFVTGEHPWLSVTVLIALLCLSALSTCTTILHDMQLDTDASAN